MIQYAQGDGNDIISGLNSDDTLKISGASYTTAKSGYSDLIIDVGSNSILVQGGANINFKINGMYSGGSNMQNISNSKSNTIISGTSSDDYIFSSGNNVTIDALSGNDYIDNYQTEKVSINAGAGNDTISSNGAYISIFAGAGNDTIFNRGKVTGYDYLSDMARPIYEITDGNIVYGGEGNDYIYNLSSNSTINGGAGDDSINLSYGAVFIKYDSGEGNDYISGLNSDDTLQISGANYTTVASGNDLIFNVGNSSITVNGGATSGFNIDGTYGNTVDTSGGGSDTSSGGGTDTGSGGSNTINNFSNNTLLSGTSSNDTINNGGSNVTINAGAGADYIYNLGNNANINGGAGDDIISLSGSNNLIIYQSGNGNDIIYGLKSNDTLQITGAEYSTVKSGSDLIINVGDNLIWAKNAANTNFKISGSISGGGTDTTPADTLPAGITVKNSIVKAAKTFTGNEINLADYEGATKVNAAARIFIFIQAAMI